jgi:hypothetical protein
MRFGLGSSANTSVALDCTALHAAVLFELPPSPPVRLTRSAVVGPCGQVRVREIQGSSAPTLVFHSNLPRLQYTDQASTPPRGYRGISGEKAARRIRSTPPLLRWPLGDWRRSISRASFVAAGTRQARSRLQFAG